MHVIRAPAASAPGAALFGAPLLAAVLIGAVSFDAAAAGSSAVHDLVIHAGTLLDGVSDAPRRRISIRVHEDKIESVQAGWIDQPGAEVVDLTEATVMPGFIDCHVHISALLPSRTNATEYWVTHTDIDRALDAAQFVRRMLQQGFTAARDVGGGDETVSVRNAIAAGKTAGPRLWVSLEPLGPTAGHGDPHNGLDAGLSHAGWDHGIVNTPDEARLRVREHRGRGADLIKLMPSGGIASSGDDPRMQLMTNDEMRAAIETAHSLGMKVAAHIYPAPAIENAVRAGVDSVEHGSFATAETFSLMRAHGTYLVPTLSVYEVYYAAARDHPELLMPGTAAKEIANDLLPKLNFPLAVKSGVKIAYGTDLGEGDHTLEFSLMTDNGLAPLQALYAATRNAAELIGVQSQIGSVQPGRYADLVATAKNPLEEPGQFRQVVFVMKGGIVYRKDGAPTPAGAE